MLRTWILLSLFLLSALSKSSNSSSIKPWQNENLEPNFRLTALNSHYRSLMQSNPDSVVYYSKIEERLGKKLNISDAVSRAYLLRGKAYMYTNQFDSSSKYLLVAKESFEINKDSLGSARAMFNLGKLFTKNKSFENGLHYYLSASKVSEALGNSDLKARAYTGLASIFEEIRDFTMAEEYYNKSIEEFKKLGDHRSVQICYLNVANALNETGSYDLALHINEIANSFLQKNTPSIITAYYHRNKAESYFQLDSLEKAKIHFKSSVDLFEGIVSVRHELIYCYSYLGKCFLNTDVDSSLYFGKKALSLYEEKSGMSLKVLKDTYDLLYKVYVEKNELKQAIEMQSIASTISKELLNERMQKEIIRETIKHQYENKMAKNQFLYTNEIRYERLKYSALILFLILVSFIVFMVKRTEHIKVKTEHQELLFNFQQIKNEKQVADEKVRRNTTGLDWVEIRNKTKVKLNETDRKVLSLLFHHPEYSNLEIAQKVFLSTEGVNSALKKMYRVFNVSGKNKKIALLIKLIRLSRN